MALPSAKSSSRPRKFRSSRLSSRSHSDGGGSAPVPDRLNQSSTSIEKMLFVVNLGLVVLAFIILVALFLAALGQLSQSFMKFRDRSQQGGSITSPNIPDKLRLCAMPLWQRLGKLVPAGRHEPDRSCPLVIASRDRNEAFVALTPAPWRRRCRISRPGERIYAARRR